MNITEGKLTLKIFRVKKNKQALLVQINSMLLGNSLAELKNIHKKWWICSRVRIMHHKIQICYKIASEILIGYTVCSSGKTWFIYFHRVAFTIKPNNCFWEIVCFFPYKKVINHLLIYCRSMCVWQESSNTMKTSSKHGMDFVFKGSLMQI